MYVILWSAHLILGLEKTYLLSPLEMAGELNKLNTVEAHSCDLCFAGPRHDIIMCMKASAVGKVGVEVKRAYLAGLIDGDWCIMATIERHHEKKFGFRVRVEVKITQKESELLKSLAQEFKIGRVSRKNKQIVIALRILKRAVVTKQDLIKNAQLADALSKFNVRSKNRRKNFATMI